MFEPQAFALLGLCLIISLTFHEFAHAFVAYRLGDETAYREGRVTLNPLVHLDIWGSICFLVTQGFGWARPVPVDPRQFKSPRRDDILVTAAGPISNFILALICGLLFFSLLAKGVLPKTAEPDLLRDFLSRMTLVNLSLGFFNLIPIYPLDGSHIVKNLLPLNLAYRFVVFSESYGAYLLLAVALIRVHENKTLVALIIQPMVLHSVALMRGAVSLVF